MSASILATTLQKLAGATPEQQRMIDRVLAGEPLPVANPAARGPLLLTMNQASELLGVSRTTLWRMTRIGLLARVEVLPGSYRVRRCDVEAIAAGKAHSESGLN